MCSACKQYGGGVLSLTLMPSSYILSLETATRGCSVALHDQGQLVTSVASLQQQRQSECSAAMVAQLLHLTGIERTALDAIAVSSGPGSYTGLRIGLSLAKGMALGLQVPLVALDTLHIMAEELRMQLPDNTPPYLVSPLLDARRERAYGALLRDNGEIILPTATYTVEEVQRFSAYAHASLPLYYIGPGAESYHVVLSKSAHSYLMTKHTPRAEAMGRIAFSLWHKKKWSNLQKVAPQYLGN